MHFLFLSRKVLLNTSGLISAKTKGNAQLNYINIRRFYFFKINDEENLIVRLKPIETNTHNYVTNFFSIFFKLTAE